MKYLLSKEIAKLWNVSERSIRNYCLNSQIHGAYKKGRKWYIPMAAVKPLKTNSSLKNKNPLLKRLLEAKRINYKGGIYHKTQILFAYNSNHIEGSTLTYEETQYIFDENKIIKSGVIYIDDIIETVNHFKCFDYILDNANKDLTESFIKKLHSMLKENTSDSRLSYFKVGEYKTLANEVNGFVTSDPKEVKKDITKLLKEYKEKENIGLNDIIDFHYKFEKIHPFQDGNGRVGRLIMFKECLKNNLTPFIIDDELKIYYYRGLKKYNEKKGFLFGTIEEAVDKYKKIVDYFGAK